MAISSDPVPPNGGVPLSSSDETGADNRPAAPPTPQQRGPFAVPGLANVSGRPDARFNVSGPQADAAADRGAMEGRSEAAEGAALAITPEFIDAQIETVLWPYDTSLPGVLELISLMQPESEQPIKLEKLAEHLALGFEQHLADGTPARIDAYERLGNFAHSALHQSAQTNRDDYVKAFEAIARLTHYLPTGSTAVHLWTLYEGRDLPMANVEVGARAALAVLDETFPEHVRSAAFLYALAEARNFDAGQRKPLLMVVVENLHKCPLSPHTSAIPSSLVELSLQEGPSCKRKVNDAAKKFAEAYEGNRRGLSGPS